MTAADIARLDVPAAELTVQLWNKNHPIGTPVVAYPGFRPEHWASSDCRRLTTRTRTEAWVLSGHTAVVMVEGHGACIALSHVDFDQPVAELESLRPRLPLLDPARHALDAITDRQFAAIAAQWGEAA